MVVIVGKGIHHAIEVPNVPRIGEEFNLASMMLEHGGGRFRVASVGTIMWGKGEFPHVMAERIGEIPAGETGLPMAVLNC